MFDPETHAFDEQMLSRLLLECDEVLLDTELTAQLAEVDAVLLQMLAPVSMHPADPHNALLQEEATFERTCIGLERLGVARPGELSLYAFYARVRANTEKPKAE